MTDLPISYSPEMVRARRAGLKTMTRRIARPRGRCSLLDGTWTDSFVLDPGNREWLMRDCPYGQPGDRLWVREAWKTLAEFDDLPGRALPAEAPVWYLADGPAPARFGRYRHARFMPRRISRGLDEVLAVRVERLREISEADAMAEGLSSLTKAGSAVKWGIPDRDGLPGTDDDGWPWAEWDMLPCRAYRRLWDRINGAGAWDADPLVWVVSFKVLLP